MASWKGVSPAHDDVGGEAVLEMATTYRVFWMSSMVAKAKRKRRPKRMTGRR